MRRYALLALLLICSVAHAETIAEKLTRIDNEKTALKTAIEAKGQSVTTFETYSEAVASITTGGPTVPGAYPAGLQRDSGTVATETWSDGTKLGELRSQSATYCGNGLCLVGTYGGGKIFKSLNFGTTWELSYDSAGDQIQSIAYCGNKVVLATVAEGTKGYIYRSTNNGLSNWSKITPEATEQYYHEVVFCGSDTCVLGMNNGKIYYSTNNGVNWSLASDTVEHSVRTFAAGEDGVVIAGGAGATAKLFKSEDYGITWSLSHTISAASMTSALAYCGSGTFVAGTNYSDGLIVRSTDNGESWSTVYDTEEVAVHSLEYCENGIVFAGTGANGKIFRSDDYGATWELDTDMTESAIGNITYMGNGAAIATSEDASDSGNHAIVYKRITHEEKDTWK